MFLRDINICCSWFIYLNNVILMYVCLWFKLRIVRMLVGVLVLFTVLAVISAFALHDHKSRKFMIGMVGIFSSIGLYGSPLVVMVSSFFRSSNSCIYIHFTETYKIWKPIVVVNITWMQKYTNSTNKMIWNGYIVCRNWWFKQKVWSSCLSTCHFLASLTAFCGWAMVLLAEISSSR